MKIQGPLTFPSLIHLRTTIQEGVEGEIEIEARVGVDLGSQTEEEGQKVGIIEGKEGGIGGEIITKEEEEDIIITEEGGGGIMDI